MCCISTFSTVLAFELLAAAAAAAVYLWQYLSGTQKKNILSSYCHT